MDEALLERLDDHVFDAMLSRLDELDAAKALNKRGRITLAVELTDKAMEVFNAALAEKLKSSRASEAATKRWAAAKAAAPKKATASVPRPLADIVPSLADPVPATVVVPPTPPKPAPKPTKVTPPSVPVPPVPPTNTDEPPPLPPAPGAVPAASAFGATS